LRTLTQIGQPHFIFELIPGRILIHFCFAENFPSMIYHEQAEYNSYYQQTAIKGNGLCRKEFFHLRASSFSFSKKLAESCKPSTAAFSKASSSTISSGTVLLCDGSLYGTLAARL